MMEGLYATVNLLTNKVYLNHFPFGTDACRRELIRLQREDPPVTDDIVPSDPINSIDPKDRPLAYHLLLRATSSIVNERPRSAVPYFMAFSALAEVRFACIRLLPESTGIHIALNIVDDDDFDRVQQNFIMLITPTGTMH